jgi:hypothetical protein
VAPDPAALAAVVADDDVRVRWEQRLAQVEALLASLPAPGGAR